MHGVIVEIVAISYIYRAHFRIYFVFEAQVTEILTATVGHVVTL